MAQVIQAAAPWPGDVLDDIGGDVARGGDLSNGRTFKQAALNKQINHGDEADSADQRTWKVLLRILYFGSD